MGFFCSTVLLFIVIGIAASEWSFDDGKNRAIRCFEQIVHDGEISNLLIDVTTPEKIDDFCRKHAELQKCTRDNEHYLTVKENTEYLHKIAGVHNFYLNVCPPGTDITADYKGNAPCFKLIRNEILSCGSTLPDLNSYKMKNDMRSKCCALEKHNECLKKATLEYCGNEAATVVEKIVQRYFDRKLKACNSSSYSCGDSGYTTVKDWASTRHKWNIHSSKWNFPSTNEYRTTETSYKRRTTEREDQSTTAANKGIEWKLVTEADAWKKHHHSGNAVLTINSAVSIVSCVAAILFHKL